MSNDWQEKMSSLLGKQVTVVLAHDDPKAVARGKLLSYSEDGEVTLQDDGGILHHCWPNLHILAEEEP